MSTSPVAVLRCARMAELVDAVVFKTMAHEACRFKSGCGHT